MQGHVTFLFLLAFLVPLAAAYPWQICESTAGNYTANSTYQANLSLLSTTLPTNASTSPTLFATDVIGAVPDKVFALTLCRGDTNASACLTCVTQVFQDEQQLCPYNKDVTIYYDPCLLRFSNQNFLASTDNSQEVYLYNSQNITDPKFPGWDPNNSTTFVALLMYTLLNDTAQWAAYKSTRRFATARTEITSSIPTLYSLMQCTPDLSPSQCWQCLQQFINTTLRTFNGPQGVRIIGVRCCSRYEIYSFYNGDPMLRIGSLTAPAVPTINSTAPPTPVMIPAPPSVTTAGEQGNGTSCRLLIQQFSF